MKECTQEQFLRDVTKHQMQVLRDDGVYRHLKFRAPTHSWNQWFELITWPGTLVIGGDMGTWAFSRVEDMFKFFRGDDINAHYWAEKCEAVSRRDDIEDFDAETFKAEVLERLVGWDLAPDELAAVTSDLQDEVFGPLEDHDNEHKAYELLYDFKSHGVSFDCELPDGKVDNFRFIWCLRAIVWGIQQYDKGKAVRRG